MRYGSDIESVLLLLISTGAEGREGGQTAGLRASEKRLRDDVTKNEGASVSF